MALVKRTYVDQTTIITADNLNDIQDEIIANGLNIEKHSGVFADEYSSASLYSVGDYCTHDNLLYKCNTAIAVTEDWNPAHWTAVTVGDELEQADWNEADNTKPDYIKNKPSIPVIDDTLSTQGQAADAKATGDKITEAEQIMSYLETGNAASRNYSAGEYVNWKGVLYTVNTGGISSGASFVAGSGGNLSAVGDGGGLNSLKTSLNTEIATRETYVRPNLLDNWYFGNPVNQRGQNSYSNAGYSIDRWKIVGNGTSISVGNSLGVSFSAGTAGSFMFKQILEPKSIPSNGKITLSGLFGNVSGNIICRLRLADSNGTLISAEGFDVANGVISHTINAQSGIASAELQIYNKDASASSFDFYAIKLESGSTQTLAHLEGSTWVLNEIPDYDEQLYRCCASTADSSDDYANNPYDKVTNTYYEHVTWKTFKGDNRTLTYFYNTLDTTSSMDIPIPQCFVIVTWYASDRAVAQAYSWLYNSTNRMWINNLHDTNWRGWAVVI